MAAKSCVCFNLTCGWEQKPGPQGGECVMVLQKDWWMTRVSLQVYVPHMFWITVLDAFYQSLVCFFIPYFVSRLYQHIHHSQAVPLFVFVVPLLVDWWWPWFQLMEPLTADHTAVTCAPVCLRPWRDQTWGSCPLALRSTPLLSSSSCCTKSSRVTLWSDSLLHWTLFQITASQTCPERVVCRKVMRCVVLQTWIHGLVLLLSGGSYFGFVLLFSVSCVTCSPPTNPLGVETLQMSQPLFWIICAVTTLTALLPRYTLIHTHTTHKTYAHILTHTCLVPFHCGLLWTLDFVCSPLQDVVPSFVQHHAPHRCPEVLSRGRAGVRELPQENAAMEPEPPQSQPAAGVCRQPRPGAQHSLSGVLTSTHRHTHTDTHTQTDRQRAVWKDCWCSRAGFVCTSQEEDDSLVQ